MIGIILAGGTGSRLYPLTKVTNKHLLSVGGQPMIYHPIRKLSEVDIDKILMVTGTEHMGAVMNLLGSGKDFDCRFTYKVQDGAGEIAQALGLAENFVDQDSMTVILGDNIFQTSLQKAVNDYSDTETQILLKEVDDPERLGVAEVEGETIVSIEEKPEEPKSNLAASGIYMFDAHVVEYIRMLESSDHGELEITGVNNKYIEQQAVHFSILEGWWTDAGTPGSYRRADKLAGGKEQ